MSVQAIQEENVIREGGFIIDRETGEILGNYEIKEEFSVKDEASANWVLERILEARSEAAKNRLMLESVRERLEANAKSADRKADWLTQRFGPELEEFAREKLVNAKTRTLKLTWGSLSFRKVKGGLRVSDAEKALEYALTNLSAGCIKVTKAFQISAISDFEREKLMDEVPEGFEIKPDTESFSISSGVSK